MVEPGSQLLHFRVVAKIGKGGMGEVWKGIDTSLDRAVAIKVLPQDFVGNDDRVARLEREAKLLGSLNHPNIATVHGLHVDPADGRTRFLVMELVEGEDLSERLARRGAIPHAEAIGIARQIAEALEAAHAAGVIHRDLKPANVKLTADGRVKVLDFGLARAVESAPTPSGSGEISPSMSPTLTKLGTVAGVILGTAAYMSPEQARGQQLDARTDVWSFGVVLYEMLTGRTAFAGDTASDTLAAVLKLEPDFDALPPDVPRRVRRLLTRCLRKERKQRLHHIADARIMLEEALIGDADEPAETRAPRLARERLGWLAALVLVGLTAGAASWWLRAPTAPAPHRKVLLALDGEDPDDPQLHQQEISPDGTRIAYRNGDKIFVRDLDDWASRELSSAAGGSDLFWSPGGDWLGFSRDDALWRVSPDGGAATKICDKPGSVAGFSWSENGEIVMSGTVNDKAGLWAVPERGCEPRAVVLAEEGTHFHYAHALPGGNAMLTSLHARPEMHVAVVADGKLERVFEIETNVLPVPVYASSGHILFNRGSSNRGIWAVPFSLSTLRLAGEPFLVAADHEQVSVSRDGVLTFVRRIDPDPPRQLVWVDRQGKILETIGEPSRGISHPSLSPDGRRIAVRVGGQDDKDIWIVDVARGTRTPLTFTKQITTEPVWTPDGQRVLYQQGYLADGKSSAMITNADRSGQPRTLVEDSREFNLSPDGRYLIVSKRGDDTKLDLWVRELDGDAELRLLLGTESSECCGVVSPDGDYVAYVSDESGRDEVYLTRFPSARGKWRASVDGGRQPRWNPRGDELFWLNNASLMVVDFDSGPSPRLGPPRELFEWKSRGLLNDEFDMTPDAQRFVMVAYEKEEEKLENEVMLVENWLAGF